jgi:hypothetical protein
VGWHFAADSQGRIGLLGRAPSSSLLRPFALVSVLDRVRQTRNDAMHFDPTLEEEAARELRDLATFLRRVIPASA